jgi:argininosuccinate lyase
VGKIVRMAGETNRTLDQISLGDLQALSPLFDIDLANVFDVRRSLAARTGIGAPSPENIAAQTKRWRAQLSK